LLVIISRHALLQKLRNGVLLIAFELVVLPYRAILFRHRRKPRHNISPGAAEKFYAGPLSA